MTSRTLILSIALAIGFGPAVIAQDAPPPPPHGEHGGHDEAPPTPLEAAMHKMNRAFKALRKQVGDASQNASSLELVATIKESAKAARKETPSLTEKQPEADRAKFVEGFQSHIDSLLATLDDLETALKAGKNDEAVKLVAKLGDEEKSGHKDYKPAD